MCRSNQRFETTLFRTGKNTRPSRSTPSAHIAATPRSLSFSGIIQRNSDDTKYFKSLSDADDAVKHYQLSA